MTDTHTWTPWTAALAWGEAVVEWHLAVHPAPWDTQPPEWARYTAVAYAHGTLAVAARTALPIAEVTHPDQLAGLSLAAVVLDVVDSRRLTTVVPGPAETGHADHVALAGLLAQGGAEPGRFRRWCLEVGTRHLADVDHRQDARLGERCDALLRVRRQELLAGIGEVVGNLDT
ncbi:hypothetical protein [Allokutzneria oryzae]|uniref:Uncharacterized protein n=1 Tax=Allokutzneria oryzae TaxID=1378989 RepID=A0ABV5ZZG5_9PSEU